MDFQFDFLVIGSGLAGLTFALKAAESGTVAMVTKKGMMESNTAKAQGGIASVLGPDDSFDLHIKDTLVSGSGLCDPAVVAMVVKKGPDCIQELIDLGANFNLKNDQASNTELDLGREGGHSHKRIVHAQDMTGREVERVLAEAVKKHTNITIYEHFMAIDLIIRSTRMKRGKVVTSHEDQCCGAYVLNCKTNRVKTFSAAVTLLAAGGCGKVYLYTSNPDIATGDGIAMGYRAGAALANLEFVQFHPTCLYHPDAKNFLISEAVRGEGGILLDHRGYAFMASYDSQKDLACRDIVARAIDNELKKSGADCVYLDISHKDTNYIRKRFPNLYAKCLEFGIDMTTEPVPVVPAAHYICGGISVDMCGRTNIKNLYAIGENACTGLHGANRLASNSLLEALVYANSAASTAAKNIDLNFQHDSGLPAWDEMDATDSDEVIMVSHNWDEIRRLMWNYVGIVRSDKRLARAMNRIKNIRHEIQDYYWNFKVSPDLIELRNIADVAELIVQCATQRKESRGLHYNIGYPSHDDVQWKKNTIIRRLGML